MNNRLEFDKVLRAIPGNPNVYFQPPGDEGMKYPAIKYSLDDLPNNFANNNVYMQSTYYQVIVLDKNPDGDIFKHVSRLPGCSFINHYKADNINHYVFRIYY